MLNSGRKIIAMVIGLGLLAFLADTFLDWLYYDKAFWSLLFTGIPAHQLYSRLITVALFISFGIFAARLLSSPGNNLNGQTDDEDAQRFRIFVENANDIVYTLSLDGVFTYVSPNWQECLGVPAEEVTGKPFAPNVHPDDVHLCNDFLRDVAQGRAKKASVEYRVRHKDGSWRWHVSRGSPIRDRDGKVVSYVGIARDVTERRQDSMALAESERKYRELFEGAPVGIFTSSSSGDGVSCNPAMAHLLGFDSPGQASAYYDDLSSQLYVHKERRDEFLRLLRENGSVDDFEYEARLADGGKIWLCTNARKVDRDDGSFSIDGFQTDITERKLAEQALAESERKYRELFESAPIGTYTTSLAGKALGCNHAMANILEAKSPEEVLNYYTDLRASYYVDEERRDDLLRLLRKNGSVEGFEFEARSIDDRNIWLSANARLTSPNDDGLSDIEGFLTDITERKLAELALAASGSRYRKLFESAPICIFTTSSEGQFISCNPTTASLFGFASPEQMIENIGDIGTQIYSNSERRLEFLRLMEENGRVENFEFEVRTAAGRTTWLEMNSRLANRKEDGSFTVEGFATDVTERKLAEAERERLLSAIEQTGEIVLITDSEGIIEYVNPAFERITGYSRKEVLGLKPSVLKSEKQDEKFYSEMWQTLTSGRTWTGRLVNKRKDRTLYTEDATISPVRDENGEIAHYVAVMHDITEHLRISEEKSKLEAQFQQAQKLESIGRLAGGVAHDLNNLLSPILGYGEMILEDLEEESPLKPSVAEIVSAGVRARDLVGQLLAFSRKQVLEFKPVELNRVLNKFESLLRSTIREDVIIDIVADVSNPTILGDSGQLEQVLMNLAVNAQDAMPDGGKLTIETVVTELDAGYAAQKQDVEPGEYVMLGVSDTGSGIDPDIVEHIFEPFFTTKNKEEGTGLGLATVYGIVKQHSGHIWVYSEPGKGTTFKVYFPVSRDGGIAFSDNAPKASNLHGSETILLVEDNEPVRSLILKILSRLDYNILVAENGESALTILEHHDGPVQMLLTDVIMPGMNGRDLFDRVSRREAGVKVLFMSGYTDNVIAHHGIIDEGVNFIQKPFSVQALAAKVREVLTG
jgi:PAS domain S-box-containing protein